MIHEKGRPLLDMCLENGRTDALVPAGTAPGYAASASKPVEATRE
ncbi:hypothetical protein ACFSKU_21570 [Pontibacter silvestris]|uniref:Uncharacterized protein n=1 Tax=Pontibacter silvestris TaxID=2305183 RepID=A0ABW4X543_9BACT|nr:hypothetical protein [Pontibacter silvestris]